MAVAAMVLVSVVVYHANVLRITIFVAYILFYVQLPGTLLRRLLRIESGHYSSDMLLSFFMGWALTVGLYFLSDALGSDILLLGTGPVLSLACIVSMARDRSAVDRLRSFSPSRIPAAFFIFVVLMIAFVMLTTQYLYNAPEVSARIYVSMDKSYEMGLISQLAQGYPLRNPWVAGRNVHYHIFTQILLSIPVRHFGLTPDFAVMTCGPLLTVYVFGLGVYSMFRYFSRHPERAGLYSLSVVLAHMFVAREPYASYMFRILLTNENYAGHAVVCCVAWVILLDVYLKSPEMSRRLRAGQCAMLALIMMLLTGIKAPIGLVMVGALIGTVILSAILRKADLRVLPVTVISFIGFYIVYRIILGSEGTSGVGGESIIGFGNVANLSYWKAPLIELMNNAGFPYVLRLAVVFAVFTVFFFSIYLVPFVIGYIRELVLVLKGDKDYNIARVTVYAAAFVGFFLMMLLSYYGHSQIYFGTVDVLFAPLIAFWFFEDTGKDSSAWMLKLRRLSYICFCVVLVYSTATLAWHYSVRIPGAVKHADESSKKYNKYMSLTADEFEAVNWIKANLDDDVLIATQMYASVPYDTYNVERRWDSLHFLYAAYSCRRFYLEGSGYTFAFEEIEKKAEMERNEKRLFDPDDPERGSLARELGVTHLIVTKHIHPVGDLSSDDFKLIYSNKDIDLYEVTS